ncbi:hypothetical protein OKW50_008150 [Paraburkholderia youngii]|uniref:hypothetical protein n=1 Tax=Paraburkholderia youngii TaxID=2782701 RepID=UPI003D1EFE66
MMSVRRAASHFLTTAIFATALTMAGPVHAAGKSGEAFVVLKYIDSVLRNGSPDPSMEHRAFCAKKLSEPATHYHDMKVATTYDVVGHEQSAKSNFPSPVSTQPLELTVDLHPLGIEGKYAFGAFRPSPVPDDYVLFSMSLEFKDPTSTFLIINEDKPFNCVISSASDPFTRIESGKFAVDSK